jgi:hypothetical protein
MNKNKSSYRQSILTQCILNRPLILGQWHQSTQKFKDEMLVVPFRSRVTSCAAPRL